ncbi:hypothetical protein AMJ44_05190 [candidate division WOR-1 bacterium DG_54_3]|uniref:Methyltransferase domain-containing protein n=1 Tax=candidate division WOR-1 bacterium DG_54_3 TaxID=1703775 RepID=A0A0S7Y2W9_UNCSA|nr:MAG: hypothetical protein AMJ44_05190 [candidate division WOR-1 bacterium DG_54_3]
MKTDVERWLESDGEKFLKEIGVKKGQKVLDFGCGEGHYTIPAAKVVGKEGKVFAVDKDKSLLGELAQIARKENLDNIKPIAARESLEIPKTIKMTVDVVLLYDVIHLVSHRNGLYRKIYRILNSGGILSIYPKHYKLDSPGWGLGNMDLEDIIKEIESMNFHFKGKILKTLLHDDYYNRGYILNFWK